MKRYEHHLAKRRPYVKLPQIPRQSEIDGCFEINAKLIGGQARDINRIITNAALAIN